METSALRFAVVAAMILLLGTGSSGFAADVVRRTPDSVAELQLSFAKVVRGVSPAVVSVHSRTATPAGRGMLSDEPFLAFSDGDRRRRTRGADRGALGSGVVVGADGLVVTNHHVVADAEGITVVLADQREFSARVVGADERADLALLKLDDEPVELPALPLADPGAVEVGDIVLAVGNPFGIGQTVTSGIVSALARTNPSSEADVAFIQTDAAINPGNSGGALVDMQGRLVGVNTVIFTRGGGSIGIGFAIPAALVAALVRSVEDGHTRLARPWLGADGQAIGAEVAASLGLEPPRGVLLSRVYPGGPADRLGLRRGDIVLAVDGDEVDDPRGLSYLLTVRGPGAVAEIEAWQRGARTRLQLPLEAPPEVPPRSVTTLRGRHPLSGATVANLSPAFNDELGIDVFERGVIVLDVERRSPAARLRLRSRDVVTLVNDSVIASVRSLKAALADPHATWQVAIRRNGSLLSVQVDE